MTAASLTHSLARSLPLSSFLHLPLSVSLYLSLFLTSHWCLLFPCAQTCLSSTHFTSTAPSLYFSAHFSLFGPPYQPLLLCRPMCMCVLVWVRLTLQEKELCVHIHVTNLSVHIPVRAGALLDWQYFLIMYFHWSDVDWGKTRQNNAIAESVRTHTLVNLSSLKTGCFNTPK